jgi:hypothetical protein
MGMQLKSFTIRASVVLTFPIVVLLSLTFPVVVLLSLTFPIVASVPGKNRLQGPVV